MITPESKHIDIQYHFLKDRVQKGANVLNFVPIDFQVVDILTKPLAKGKFEILGEKNSLVENTFFIKRKCSFLLQVVLLTRGRTSVEEDSFQDECATWERFSYIPIIDSLTSL